MRQVFIYTPEPAERAKEQHHKDQRAHREAMRRFYVLAMNVG